MIRNSFYALILVGAGLPGAAQADACSDGLKALRATYAVGSLDEILGALQAVRSGGACNDATATLAVGQASGVIAGRAGRFVQQGDLAQAEQVVSRAPGLHWAVQAVRGDIAAKRGDRGEAAQLYNAALDTITDPALTKANPNLVPAAERLTRLAQENMMLAGTLESTVTRGGAPTGVLRAATRGIAIESYGDAADYKEPVPKHEPDYADAPKKDDYAEAPKHEPDYAEAPKKDDYAEAPKHEPDYAEAPKKDDYAEAPKHEPDYAEAPKKDDYAAAPKHEPDYAEAPKKDDYAEAPKHEPDYAEAPKQEDYAAAPKHEPVYAEPPKKEVYEKLYGGGKQEDYATADAVAKVTTTVFLPIKFASNSHDLDGKARHEVDYIGAFLASNGIREITLVGHTDERGSDDYNLDLSFRRAQAVREYLTYYLSRYGNQTYIHVDGKGERVPPKLSDPYLYSTEERHAIARRVELVLHR